MIAELGVFCHPNFKPIPCLSLHLSQHSGQALGEWCCGLENVTLFCVTLVSGARNGAVAFRAPPQQPGCSSPLTGCRSSVSPAFDQIREAALLTKREAIRGTRWRFLVEVLEEFIGF